MARHDSEISRWPRICTGLCAIRTAEFQRAHSVAEAYEQAVSDPYFRQLIAIADGNTDLATQLMYACMEQGYSPHAIFQDPDAEHCLLQPTFIEFRQMFLGQGQDGW